MIHVIDELHLNDFKEVRCARPRDLFARYGKRESPISFDSNLDEAVPMNMDKLQSLEYLEKYDSMMQEATQSAEHSEADKEPDISDDANP